MSTGRHVYRFKSSGPTADEIGSQVPVGTTVYSVAAFPPRYRDIDVENDSDDPFPDLESGQNSDGYVFDETDPPASGAKTIKQVQSATLGSDGSQITVPINQTESAWTDKVTRTLTTKGGTTVGTLVTAIVSAGVGEGRARLVVDGGDFSNQVIGADYHAIAMLSRGTASFHHPVSVPATTNETEYTFKLQMQATGTLGTLTPRKGCALTVTEYV